MSGRAERRRFERADRELCPKQSTIAVRVARTPGSRAEQGDPATALTTSPPTRGRVGIAMVPPVRGRLDPRLVEHLRTGTLPCGYELDDDHPRLWRLERHPATGHHRPRVWLVGVRGWSG
jgi:hypothetical protein